MLSLFVVPIIEAKNSLKKRCISMYAYFDALKLYRCLRYSVALISVNTPNFVDKF